jgi:hypothetical protein
MELSLQQEFQLYKLQQQQQQQQQQGQLQWQQWQQKEQQQQLQQPYGATFPAAPQQQQPGQGLGLSQWEGLGGQQANRPAFLHAMIAPYKPAMGGREGDASPRKIATPAAIHPWGGTPYQPGDLPAKAYNWPRPGDGPTDQESANQHLAAEGAQKQQKWLPGQQQPVAQRAAPDGADIDQDKAGAAAKGGSAEQAGAAYGSPQYWEEVVRAAGAVLNEAVPEGDEASQQPATAAAGTAQLPVPQGGPTVEV